MDLLFCHRWLLLGFKREFHDMHVMRMWEACWSHYQTEFFHIFICVAIVLEYGDPVWQKSMRVDEMLNYFNNLALEMDGDQVLRQARSLLYQFRRLAAIPCTLRGLLSGPGAWDSATLPEIECTCHETNTCKYSNPPSRGKRFLQEHGEVKENEEDGDKKDLKDTNSQEKHDDIEQGQENGLNWKKEKNEDKECHDLNKSEEETEDKECHDLNKCEEENEDKECHDLNKCEEENEDKKSIF